MSRGVRGQRIKGLLAPEGRGPQADGYVIDNRIS